MITTVRAEIEADDESKTLDFVSIFKEVGSNTFDEFRKMAPLNRKAYKKLKDEANLLIKKFHMRWQPKEWVALKSLPGGEEQDPHRDIPAVEIGKARKKSSRAYHRPDGEHQVDIVSERSAFTELNYRIHCVLTIKGIKWRADATEFAPPPAYKGEFCPFMAPTKLQVSNHKRGCLRNPARAANRARDRELNEKGKFCCVCKKQFAKRNTYYKHYNRRHKPYLKLYAQPEGSDKPHPPQK
ncbi:hypothetical protein PR003_g25479 [Phytophthora rubi]|uniref:C2H2-type domain-containing protein n=1 Tax=Phytophthora rubi TaxID=129364 RepID=A0A6A4CFY7_9STRA|nr:hypothetical protein PR003_g25479 [Phytophthora rubi]